MRVENEYPPYRNDKDRSIALRNAYTDVFLMFYNKKEQNRINKKTSEKGGPD